MPRAKPVYDADASWKARGFTPNEWESTTKSLQLALRPFFPDKHAVHDEVFGHPADEFANVLLSGAVSAYNAMLNLHRRLTNEQLRAERNDLLRKLKNADRSLDKLSTALSMELGATTVILTSCRNLKIAAESLIKISPDLDVLLGHDADALGCRDKLTRAATCLSRYGTAPSMTLRVEADVCGCRSDVAILIARVDHAEELISRMPRAAKLADAQHHAAVEIAVRVLHSLLEYGVSTAATADSDEMRTSDAIKILKIIGDQIGLRLAESTWRDTIIAARKSSPSLIE